jgi:predicted anti-sigma-YlaC factor YlaD
MTGHSPTVAFGLAATHAALAAKAGRFGLRDRVAFAVSTLRHLQGDPEVSAAVADFLTMVEDHPQAAGVGLQAFVESWLDRVTPREAETIMQGEDTAPLFDWQLRRDLQ